MKNAANFLALALLVALPAFAEGEDAAIKPVVTVATTSQRLGDVKKIFVAPLGSGQGADMVRQKVINGLIKDGTVTVTESADDADATLVGACEVSGHQQVYVNRGLVSSFIGGTKYHADSALRLLGKDKQVLWLDEVSSRSWFPSHTSKGASSDVADKAVKQLVEAIEADKAHIATKQASGL